MSRYSRSIGRPRLPRSRRTPNTVSALRITRTSWSWCVRSSAPLRPVNGVTVSLAGRDSGDYYECSVAVGLARHRRSRVRLCHTLSARLRRPTHLLQCPHWASLLRPGECDSPLAMPSQDRHRFQVSFRWVRIFTFWRFGFKQSSFRHITRVFPARWITPGSLEATSPVKDEQRGSSEQVPSRTEGARRGDGP